MPKEIIFPDSEKEKIESNRKEGFRQRAWMFAHEIITLLSVLRPDDWLSPCTPGVPSLAVMREPDTQIGVLELCCSSLTLYNDNVIYTVEDGKLVSEKYDDEDSD